MFILHYIDDLEISGKSILLDFDCHFGPWTPEGYCELDDLKNETGIDFPPGICLMIESEEHFNTDLVHEINLTKVKEDGKLIIDYLYEDIDQFCNGKGDRIEKALKKHFEIFHEYESNSIRRNMDVKNNIYKTIISDLEIIRSITKANKG